MAYLRVLSALALAALLGLAAASHAEAQSRPSPFAEPGPGRSITGPAPAQAQPDASVWSRLTAQIHAVQQRLHRQLAEAVKRFKSDGLAAGWLLGGLSFLYGIAHAVGPGHGKAVITSYVVANERTVRRGVLLSFLAAGLQAVTAVVLVGILAVLLNATGVRIRESVGWLESASYALIALIGAWLLIGQLWPARRPSHAHSPFGHSHGHGEPGHGEHGHGEDCGHAHMPDPRLLEGRMSMRKAAAVVFAVGLRPCTGAIIVLVFALAHGLFLVGVGAAFAMALGTAITVSALAAVAVGSRQLAVRLARGDERWTGRIYQAAALGGGSVLLLLGGMLFVASLGPARPF